MATVISGTPPGDTVITGPTPPPPVDVSLFSQPASSAVVAGPFVPPPGPVIEEEIFGPCVPCGGGVPGDGVYELFTSVSATAPNPPPGAPGTYLQFWVDLDGDVQTIYLGTP